MNYAKAMTVLAWKFFIKGDTKRLPTAVARKATLAMKAVSPYVMFSSSIIWWRHVGMTPVSRFPNIPLVQKQVKMPTLTLRSERSSGSSSEC